MRIKHFQSWLATLAMMLCLASEASAQMAEHIAENINPFQPVTVDPDLAPFEHFEPDFYNGPPPHKQGWFFSYERFAYWINAPEETTIGKEGLSVFSVLTTGYHLQVNSLTTGLLEADTAWGNRYEFGYVEDDAGWLVSIMDGQPQDQILDDASFQSDKALRRGVSVVFEDELVNIGLPPGNPAIPPVGYLSGFINVSPVDDVDDNLDGDFIYGRFFVGDGDGDIDPLDPADQAPVFLYDWDDLARLATYYDTMRIRNKSYIDGAELLRFHIFESHFTRSRWEFLYGIRYFRFRDRFNVFATGGILADSYWNQLANNDIIGPEIGLRWNRINGRWELSAETKFLAGINFMRLAQNGLLGSQLDIPTAPLPLFNNAAARPHNLPAFFFPIGFSHEFETTTFAPTAEARFNVAYNVSAGISLKAGWTGWFTHGVSRASNTIEYSLPVMGIRTDDLRQDLWVNMFTFGFEWNR